MRDTGGLCRVLRALRNALLHRRRLRLKNIFRFPLRRQSPSRCIYAVRLWKQPSSKEISRLLLCCRSTQTLWSGSLSIVRDFTKLCVGSLTVLLFQYASGAIVFDFYQNLNLFYGVLTECCTAQSCPTMSAGPKYDSMPRYGCPRVI